MELVAKLHPLSQEDSDANNSSDLETSANPVSIAWFDLFLILVFVRYETLGLKTVQDFLINLGIKPLIYWE